MSELFWLSVTIALGFIVAVAFYEGLSSRDVLVTRVRRTVRRISTNRWVSALTYLFTVLFLIPGLVLLWTVALAVTLFLVGSVDRVDTMVTVAAAMVGAARMLAYASERVAHELAKAIPLSLAFLLLTGGDLHLVDKLIRLSTVSQADQTLDWFQFLVALEVGLRGMTDVTHAVLARQRRRLGVADETGLWQTLRATVRRRPVGAA